MNAALWAVVPAAGTGRRMGSVLPKQYLPLDDRCVIEHTLSRLLEVPGIARIAVALDPADTHFATLPVAGDPRILRVNGGAERAHSVLNGLDALAEFAAPTDDVLVHDAARPCVRVSDIRALVESARGTPDGGLLALPVTDTMKEADANGRIIATRDRAHMWRAQTPQMFPLGILRDALRRALAEDLLVTDEAQAMENAGFRPRLVPGHPDNLKITIADDLALAAWILARQSQTV